MLKSITAAWLTTALALNPLLAQAQIAEPERVFGARESVEQISLSPDGTHVAYLTPAPNGASVLMVAAAAGGTATPIVRAVPEPFKLSWCGWASNQRLVCSLYGISNAATGDYLAFQRLVAINRDGTKAQSLGDRGGLGLHQVDGSIVDWHADDNGSILMSRMYGEKETTGTLIMKSKPGLGVDRVDTLTRSATPLEQSRADSVDYVSDGSGNVRLMETAARDSETGTYLGRTAYFYRKQGDRQWTLFSSFKGEEKGLRPVAVDATTNTAYAFDNRGGRDALVRVALDGSMTTTPVLSHPQVDIDTLVRLGRSGRVIGAELVTDKRETVYFDPKYKALAASLGKALPGLPLVRFVDASRDESKLLIFAGSDVDPGRYYVYDRAPRRLNEIMVVRPELEKAALAPVKAITFKAADGTVIPGYLTLPVGGATKGLPALVMPHGGPASRDEWGFDWLAQYFAARGYAVLQPNFRGSTGYGSDWYAQNGFRSWRTAIGDVNAGGRWLVGEGIAAPDKLAIFGWSYGGYAALQSTVLEPCSRRWSRSRPSSTSRCWSTTRSASPAAGWSRATSVRGRT